MVDVHLGPVGQALQFAAQEFRRHVLGDGGQLFQVVGEGGLGDDVLHRDGHGCQELPPFGAWAGVAGVGQGLALVLPPEHEAAGALGVVHRAGREAQAAHADGFAGGHGHVAQHRGIGGDDREIGPDGVVQQVGGDGLQHVGQAVNVHGRAGVVPEELDQVVRQEEDVLDVVQVRVGDEDVRDFGLFVQRQVGRDGTGVQEDVLVHEKGRQVMPGQIRA